MPNVLEQLLGGNNQGVDTQKILQQLFGTGSLQGGSRQIQQPAQGQPSSGDLLSMEMNAAAGRKRLSKKADSEAEQIELDEGSQGLTNRVAKLEGIIEQQKQTIEKGKEQQQMRFIQNPNPFGLGGPDPEGNFRDIGGAMKILSLLAGAGIPSGVEEAQAMRQQTKGVYGFDPATRQLSQVGEVPKSADVRNVMPDIGGEQGIMNQEDIQGGQTDPVSGLTVPPGMEISNYSFKYGKMIPSFRKIQPTLAEKERGKIEAKLQESKLSSQHNLQIVGEVAHDLTSLLATAYKQGGAGTKYESMVTGAVRAGWVPGKEVAKKYAPAAAVVGKRTEMLLKMFPMMTQQLGKAGSVRIIESVIERIGATLPDTATPPAVARPQLEQTLKSMYRISRAVQMLDLKQLNPSTQDDFVDIIADATSRIELDDKEQKQLDGFINKALKPLDKYLREPQGQGQTGWTKEKESRYQELLNKQRGK